GGPVASDPCRRSRCPRLNRAARLLLSSPRSAGQKRDGGFDFRPRVFPPLPLVTTDAEDRQQRFGADAAPVRSVPTLGAGRQAEARTPSDTHSRRSTGAGRRRLATSPGPAAMRLAITTAAGIATRRVSMGTRAAAPTPR